MRKLYNETKDEICKENRWIVLEICEDELGVKDKDTIAALQEFINYSSIIDDIYEFYQNSVDFEYDRRKLIKKEIEEYLKDIENEQSNN